MRVINREGNIVYEDDIGDREYLLNRPYKSTNPKKVRRRQASKIRESTPKESHISKVAPTPIIAPTPTITPVPEAVLAPAPAIIPVLATPIVDVNLENLGNLPQKEVSMDKLLANVGRQVKVLIYDFVGRLETEYGVLQDVRTFEGIGLSPPRDRKVIWTYSGYSFLNFYGGIYQILDEHGNLIYSNPNLVKIRHRDRLITDEVLKLGDETFGTVWAAYRSYFEVRLRELEPKVVIK